MVMPALPHGNIQLFCINGSCEISMLVRYQQFQHLESNCVFSCRGVGVESRAALRCQILKRRCCFCARTAQGRPGPLPPAKACCTARELISGLPRHAPWLAQIRGAAAPATSPVSSPGRCHVSTPAAPPCMARQFEFAASCE